MPELISLAVSETQEAVLRHSAVPISPQDLQERLSNEGFMIDHLLQINIFWLLKSGELSAGKDYFLASGDNPHQLFLPLFDDVPQSA
jgi:hypothetical protein